MILRGGLVGLTILFFITMMTVTLGLHNGYAAHSIEDARINESVREEAMANLSEPQTPAPNPLLPDRFESTEPRAPPPSLLPMLRTLMSASLAVVSAVGVWTYRNRWWLPPPEEMSGLLDLIQTVYIAGVIWIGYRRTRRLLR